MTTTVSLVGSTGSIGTQAIEVIREVNQKDPGRFELDAIGAFKSVDLLVNQAGALHPKRVAVVDTSQVRELRDRLPSSIEVLAGPESLTEIATGVDVVLNSVVGFAGLPVTVAALKNGSRLALANKESLVAGAPVVANFMGIPGAEIIPVDSEHCAIHQCLRSSSSHTEVSKLVLTASGGPFRSWPEEKLSSVTIEDSLNHPTWNMGPKITVDSSTLMNKGLEVIEAHALFGISYENIDVVIHPQSIIHSMVEFVDGALIAQLSLPDMRLPIGYALSWPERLDTPYGSIDFASLTRLDFEVPRPEVFRCLQLAYEAGRIGGTGPAWLNAANEVA
ncbi:MAG TPA: 1-deoxy-D-xylulose-5-phosphate reductoisomerase, partial [Acidimicrobiales bacterium]|nr:1-deoxy-D-xylulose-5-phosphate reductoisomerase [Acidimicrobiales bacterium]